VKSDFGRGGVLVGEAAVKAGMADHLGSLESTIARAAALAKTRQFGGFK
jgi:ClpP class serine protease